MINTAPPASNSVYNREKLFWYDKINVSNHVCHRGAVVKELLKRADKPGSTPGNSVFCFFVPFCFFSCLVSFFQHYFSFWPVFLFSYCWPCWSCTRINNICWIPKFYFGKGISKALDLHTDQAYDQKKKKKKKKKKKLKKKNISCQDMFILWNSWFFFQC